MKCVAMTDKYKYMYYRRTKYWIQTELEMRNGIVPMQESNKIVT